MLCHLSILDTSNGKNSNIKLKLIITCSPNFIFGQNKSNAKFRLSFDFFPFQWKFMFCICHQMNLSAWACQPPSQVSTSNMEMIYVCELACASSCHTVPLIHFISILFFSGPTKEHTHGFSGLSRNFFEFAIKKQK